MSEFMWFLRLYTFPQKDAFLLASKQTTKSLHAMPNKMSHKYNTLNAIWCLLLSIECIQSQHGGSPVGDASRKRFEEILILAAQKKKKRF